MGNTPSRAADGAVHSQKDKALQRLRQLREEYGNGINANILVENAIGKGYQIGFGEFAAGSHCKRDAAGWGLGVAMSFRVTPPDKNIEGVALFGVGIDVPHGTHKLSGVAAVANIKQSDDLTALVLNARSLHSTIHTVVACNVECSIQIVTDDVFLPTHPLIHIKFTLFKEPQAEGKSKST